MLFQNKIKAMYNATWFTRYEDAGFIRYFGKEDFPALEGTPYPFPSSHGHTLMGYFYAYPSYCPDRLMVFDHGIGGGHRSYMKEIEQLCREGFRVFAYDHTGCMESGGENTGGFTQSLCDLNDCLCALRSDKALADTRISVIGHSWGGYAALNISAFHPDIERIVAISGFVSAKSLMRQSFRGLLLPYRKSVMALERASNPAYVSCDAVSALKNTRARVLVIQSADDGVAKKKYQYDVLYRAFGDSDRVEFLLLSGKGHNPNYTADAVSYLGTLGEALKKGIPQTAEEKEAFKNSFDWDRMTAQDETVRKRIRDFLYQNP